MIPVQFGTIFNTQIETETSPELRRMEMMSRARIADREAMIHGMVSGKSLAIKKTSEPMMVRTLNTLRDSIGNLLISAGERVHSA
ncbi:MAG: hypothetical protein KC435_05605 [Thermomicrobiales bacterium]|nr:hypothetical protein [Thermomicrobiales bacterium]